jgi:uncharacterized protein (DUF1501 family)
MALDRRSFVGAAALLAVPPVLHAQAATQRRFVFIIQRGAADGLNTVIPYADPAYARMRGALALEAGAGLKLDGTFALHPALATLHGLYGAGQATFFHAVASPYRDRSHFDGQNVLETGGRAPHQVKDGWLNRLLGLLPGGGRTAVALSPAVPLALRGAVDVTTYAPSALPQADQDLMLRVDQLYAKDAQLHALWSAALDARGMAGDARGGERRQDPAALGRMAAGFLARPDGPRVAMIETTGWDTHSAQAARLANQLKALDSLIGGLQAGLGAVWSQTVVLVATEFGRTVAPNGTGGTDHGTGAAAMLVGGAVDGGRVIADWPGLSLPDLHEGRDLKPTLGLDTLVSSVCAEAFSIDPQRAAGALFPGLASGNPLPGLLRGAG